ncbi:MAG: glycosyltransferase family 4 protein [Alphaproteobacteria bacterium]
MTIAVILKGYPRLSETFIAQELLALQRAGLDFRIVALRRPTDAHIHAINRAIAAPVDYLPEYLWRSPLRVLRAWRTVRRWPTYRAARAAWLREMRRDPTPNRGRRFGQALVLAAELSADVDHLHVHFLHTPASVGFYASILRGLPWTVSAHAKDIWTIGEWEKADKLAACEWLVTCTASGAGHLAEIARRRGLPEDRVELMYHGLDLSRFPPPPPRPARDGADPDDPVRLLTVGRAVEKKGFEQLLDAVAALPPTLHWRLVHIGAGPKLKKLQRRAEALGIADRIEWLGAQPQDEVIRRYAAADLFVLNCRVAENGDRDGLPNVLMEAQAMGLPVISTRVSAVPELVEHGRNGLLAPADDAAALGGLIAELIAAPDRRAALGAAGRDIVRSRFSFEGGIVRLGQKLGLAAPAEPARIASGP